MDDTYTDADVQWAKDVIADPARTAALVRAYRTNHDDPDVVDAVLFCHEVLNGRII